MSSDKIIEKYERNEKNFSSIHHYREHFYFIEKEMLVQENIKIDPSILITDN